MTDPSDPNLEDRDSHQSNSHLSGSEGGQPEHRPFVILAIVLAAVSYVNILTGDFVYDDSIQIVGNHQIKASQHWLKALTSDVWSFKGDEFGARSNYWRPAFVGWMILNHSLFGVKSSFGWHLSSLFLHMICVVLLYATLVRLGFRSKIAGAITIIFAVHPVHVETVAWVSGSIDLLMTIGLLGSLLFFLPASSRRRNWPAILACYLFALFSKETAMLFPCVVFGITALQNRRPFCKSALMDAAKKTLPFLVTLVTYVAMRVACLGFFQKPQADPGSLIDMLLTWPVVAVFYVRQILFPFWMGPSYPVRLVDSLSLTGFLIPAILFLALALIMLWSASRSKQGAAGLVMFVFVLAPAMNLRVFTPEQLVHDRYLYLPLAGFLMVFFPLLKSIMKKNRVGSRDEIEDILFGIALIVCMPLMFQTLRYNRAWATDVALWQWGVKSDPGSMFNYTQYGVFLDKAGQRDKALAALDTAIDLIPLPQAYQPNAYLQRIEILTDQKKFAAAEKDLLLVLEKYPNDFRALERYAVWYERQKRFVEAETVLRQARERIPFRECELTERIAIVLFQQGSIDMAQSELEQFQGAARKDARPASKRVLYRLALIYIQKNRFVEARTLLKEFLDLTVVAEDPITMAARKHAIALLAGPGG